MLYTPLVLSILLSWISLGYGVLKTVDIQTGYDPGLCHKTSHGLLKLVKDRSDNDKLLICSHQGGGYAWKATDGSSPSGEYFNPGNDCTDILNSNVAAKDGYYWINLNKGVPKKVWCDMSTDGGGFMLIGKLDKSITWSVPSNNLTVDPFGKPHWTSVLGDVPVLDFRVQMSTTKTFAQTKAHWFYRLQNARLLKNIMIINEGGCGPESPGIGDVAYVKDLRTDKIVTTKFRCSKFGTYHHPSKKFGWAMMNECFQKSCPKGFAFHPKYHLKTDSSGSFSYSVVSDKSGIGHNSSVFLGCDKGVCCSCFGPPDGTDDLCSTGCKVQPGGTFEKNVYSWFWVRSSLPKKVWNKCMEYKVTEQNGGVVWYKLEGQNVSPVKGRCPKNEPLLNDGIVVVPDAESAGETPPIPGILQYRKDNHKLYVSSGETWNVIAEEKKILDQMNDRFARINRSLDNLNQKLKKYYEDIGLVDVKIRASCAHHYKSGQRQDGVYKINPDGLGSFKVRCDMTTDGGGWTVFQRRRDGSQNFYRGWSDYKAGFGDFNGEFWLGLDKIHRLVNSFQDVLRVDLMDFSGSKVYAKYGSFHVAGESKNYRLMIFGYSGTAGDSLKYHHKMQFSTKDRDNDEYGRGNCATGFKAAWWYKSCHYSNLNGLYKGASGKKDGTSISWFHWHKRYDVLKESEMKIRPSLF